MVAVVLTLPDGTRLEKALTDRRAAERAAGRDDRLHLACAWRGACDQRRPSRRPDARHRIGADIGERRRPAQRSRYPASARPLPVRMHRTDHQPRHAARLPERRCDSRRARRRSRHPRPCREGDRRACSPTSRLQARSGCGRRGARTCGSMPTSRTSSRRARQKGFAVPREAFDLALANLKNRIAYAGDFTNGGEDIAYALYVLASNGRAAIGDLRYYAETKLGDFATPLAKAQIGAALALYGDKPRADAVFKVALSALAIRRGSDQGLAQRLRLLAPRRRRGADARFRGAVRHRPRQPVDPRRGANVSRRRYTSTQEDAWSLMAAHALMESLSEPKLAVDGELISGPLFRGTRRGQPGDRADDDRESRRPSDRGRHDRARCSADARAGRRQLLFPEEELLYARRPAGRSFDGGARCACSSPSSMSPRPRARARGWSSTIHFPPASRSTTRTSCRAGTWRRSTG